MATVDPKDSEAVVLYVHEDWAAFYIGGVLRNHGDDENMIEQVLEHLGVETRHGNAFLLGTSGINTRAARTLGDIDAYEQARTRDITQAARLRAEANEKVAEAARIEQRYA